MEIVSLTYERPGLATYLFLWPADGVMRKEDIRGIYDGSIFYTKAEEHQRKVKEKRRLKSTSPSMFKQIGAMLSSA